MDIKRIVGCRQRLIILAVLRNIYHFLLMLYARSHRKRLCLHRNSHFFEHLERIASRVTNSEDEPFAGQLVLVRFVRHPNCAQRVIFRNKPREL